MAFAITAPDQTTLFSPVSGNFITLQQWPQNWVIASFCHRHKPSAGGVTPHKRYPFATKCIEPVVVQMLVSIMWPVTQRYGGSEGIKRRSVDDSWNDYGVMKSIQPWYFHAWDVSFPRHWIWSWSIITERIGTFACRRAEVLENHN